MSLLRIIAASTLAVTVTMCVSPAVAWWNYCWNCRPPPGIGGGGRDAPVVVKPGPYGGMVPRAGEPYYPLAPGQGPPGVVGVLPGPSYVPGVAPALLEQLLERVIDGLLPQPPPARRRLPGPPVAATAGRAPAPNCNGADQTTGLSQDQHREWVKERGREYCAKYPRDEVCAARQ